MEEIKLADLEIIQPEVCQKSWHRFCSILPSSMTENFLMQTSSTGNTLSIEILMEETMPIDLEDKEF